MIKIGITGGIGSGKSFVARLFAEQGVPCYDCDSAAKKIMLSDAGIQDSLQKLIGIPMVNNGVLDKSAIACFLFASADNAAKINGLVHPLVIDDFNKWCAVQKSPVVAMESAILFENGLEKTVDYVIVVDAPRQVCLDRAVKRDHTSVRKIEERMDSQMDAAEKVSRADFVIYNGSGVSKTDIIGKIDIIIKSILLC